MELQNQIYLLAAIFGGLVMLLFVLLVVLSVYVRKTRKIFAQDKSGYSNDQFSGADFVGDERDRSRGVGAAAHHGYPMEMHARMDYRSDLTKARNDYVHNVRNVNHNRGYRGGEVESSYGGKQRHEKAKSNPHQSAADSRAPEAAFETEVSNIFDMDMDDLDEVDLVDEDSVRDGRGANRYLSNRSGTIGSSEHKSAPGHQYGRGANTTNHQHSGNVNRFHNAPHAPPSKRKNGGSSSSGMVRDEVEGESQSNSYFTASKEQGPYFNDRRLNY